MPFSRTLVYSISSIHSLNSFTHIQTQIQIHIQTQIQIHGLFSFPLSPPSQSQVSNQIIVALGSQIRKRNGGADSNIARLGSVAAVSAVSPPISDQRSSGQGASPSVAVLGAAVEGALRRGDIGAGRSAEAVEESSGGADGVAEELAAVEAGGEGGGGGGCC